MHFKEDYMGWNFFYFFCTAILNCLTWVGCHQCLELSILCDVLTNPPLVLVPR